MPGVPRRAASPVVALKPVGLPLIRADYGAFATEVDASMQWDRLLAEIAGAPPTSREVIEPFDSSGTIDDALTDEERREVLKGLSVLRAVESAPETPDISR